MSDLDDAFLPFGPILRLKIVSDDRNLGPHAILSYCDVDVAQAAIQALDGKECGALTRGNNGKTLKVELDVKVENKRRKSSEAG